MDKQEPNWRELLSAMADNVEELAFRMPAPNEHTPQFVQLAGAYRAILRANPNPVRPSPPPPDV